jgi:hypothetical protein
MHVSSGRLIRVGRVCADDSLVSAERSDLFDLIWEALDSVLTR